MPDGSKAPFTIKSTTSLIELHYLVGGKLDQFPDSLRLRYRLDPDKSKTGAVLIHTKDEFRLFIDRMRGLIVPELSKPPTRRKEISVCFETGVTVTGAGGDSDSGPTARTKAKVS
jgi:hypothetical protein